jgi:hypothetical protein
MPEIIDNADFGEMVRYREKLGSALDSALQKSMNLAKSFKKKFNKCKNAGLCYQPATSLERNMNMVNIWNVMTVRPNIKFNLAKVQKGTSHLN